MNGWIEGFVPVKSFFRVAEAADLLHVHQNTVRVWIDEGKLDHIRLPSGSIRVHRSAIIERLAAYAPSVPRRRRIIHPGISLTRVRR